MKTQSLLKSVSNLVGAAIVLLLLPSAVLAQGENNEMGVAGDFNGDVLSGCRYDPYTGNAKRIIPDLNVWGAIGDIPLTFTRIYNSRGNTSTCFGSYGNWTHNYQFSISDNKSGTLSVPTSVSIVYPTGEYVTFSHVAWDTFWRGPNGTADRLEVPSNSMFLDYQDGPIYGMVLHRADGTRVAIQFTVTAVYNGTRIIYYNRTYQVWALQDTVGRYTGLTYDGNNRLTQITEPGGRWIKISYAQYPTGGPFVISGLSSSYGQSVGYSYTGTYATLSTVNYYNDMPPGGGYTQAHYTYNSSGLLATCDDPHYPGAMTKIQYTYWTNLAFGFLQEEQHPNGTRVSRLDEPSSTVRIETRFDGTTRQFVYTTTGLLTSVSNFSTNGTYPDVTTVGYDANGYRNSITDPEGRVTQSTNERILGQPTRVTHPSDGSHRDFTYTDPSNPYFVATAADELGHTTTYTRNTYGQVTQIAYPSPDGGTESFTYTTDGYLLPATHTLVDGALITYSYATTSSNPAPTAWMWEIQASWNLQPGASMPTGLVTSVTATWPGHTLNDGTKQMFYDVFGRLIATQNASSSAQELFQYDHMGRTRVQTHPDAPATKVLFGYDSYGNRNSVTDENTWVTTTTFDDYRRPTTVVNPVNGSSNPTLFQYRYRDDANTADEYAFTDRRPRLTTLPSGKQSATDLTPDRRIAAAYTALHTSDCTYVKYTYDRTGKLLTKTVSKTTYGTGSGWNPPTTERTDVTNTYDARGRLWTTMDAVNPATTFSYDYANNTLSAQFPNLKSITYSNFSSLNLPKTSTDERGKITQYAYWPSGKLKDLTDANSKLYHIDYDGAGRRVDMTYPDGSKEKWDYGADGLVTTWYSRGIPDANGNPISPHKHFNTYDSRLRLTNYYWDDSPQTEGSAGVTIAYDGASNVYTMENASAKLTYSYDKLNRVTQETQLIKVSGYPANQSLSVNYAYNLDGLIKGMTYPSGQNIGLSYNNNNQLTSTGLSNASYSITTAIAQYAYNGDSTFQTRDVLTGADNVHTAYTYDNGGHIGNIHITNAAGNITSRTYNYDSLNRITYFTKDIVNGTPTPTENGKGDFFAYDDSGQLQGAWHEAPGVANASWPTGPSGAQRYEKYSFDPTGNRLTEDLGSGPVSYTASTSDPNQYITAASNGSVTYDNARTSGNTKSVGGLSCTYDANNRLTSATLGSNNVAFYYDPKGRCVARTINGGSFLASYYASWNLIEDRDGNGTIQHIYVLGANIDEVAAVLPYSGGIPTTWLGYHFDVLGNISHLSGSNGTVLERYGYNAFGSPFIVDATTGNASPITTSSPNAVGRRFSFQGREFIAQLSLYDFRNRAYHSALGRFMQPDPIRFAGGDVNIYRFCANDAVDGWDPYGLGGDLVQGGYSRYSPDGECDCPNWSPTGGGFTGDGTLVSADTPLAPDAIVLFPGPIRGGGRGGYSGPVKGPYADVPYDQLPDVQKVFRKMKTSGLTETFAFAQDAGTVVANAAASGVTLPVSGLAPITCLRGFPSLGNQVARTFAGANYGSRILSSPMQAYRYSGGVSRAAGNFLTDAATVEQISSPAAASIALRLPPGATAETLNAFTIPAGSRIFFGGVAGGADTATQIFILDKGVLIPIP
jgi:RHS repeat-associated protein